MMESLSTSPSVAFGSERLYSAVDVSPSVNLNWNRSREHSEESEGVTLTIGPFCSEVFLGGSCNPTQWRRDEAIPALKEAQVTYYNPQREDWLPNLINLEQQAKDNARVLLFVHDKVTRSLASMVEVGEWSALKKQKLVLAIEEQGDHVMGEKLSERELKEMRRCRNYMRDIAEVCRIRVHTDIRQAVQSCIDIVKKNHSKEDQKSLPNCDRTLGEKYIKMRSAFDNHASNNKLSKEERKLAFRVLHGRDLPKEIQMDDKLFVNEAEFSMINAEYRITSKPALYLPYVHNIIHRRPPSDKYSSMHKEVFICGPTGELQWKKKIAHTIFEKAHVFTRDRSDLDAEHLMPMEMEQIEKCRVLLFVFPSDTWGGAEMIMASYYIGMGKQVVLCTQQVCEGTLVYGERLTATQAKDYNRSRMYLSDQAMRNKVPVFDNIAEAVAKAAELAKE